MLRGLLFAFLLLISFSLSTPKRLERAPSSVVPDNCTQIFFRFAEADRWAVLAKSGYGSEYRVAFDELGFYEGYRRILKLSDGAEGSSFAHDIANHYPLARVISSDYSFDDLIDGNFARAYVDNTKKLPFPDNSFDMIVMRRGLCTCQSACQTCGGFNLNDKETLKSFIREVVRILDLSNPHAKAYLHGAFYSDPAYALKIYREVQIEVQQNLGAEILLLKHDRNYLESFAGYLIKARVQ